MTWSTPVTRTVRVTSTPRVSLTTSAAGSVLVRMWDVAPDGHAVLVDETAAAVRKGRSAFELKSTDWTLLPGHRLAVQVGTVDSTEWVAVPTFASIRVTRARLVLALQDPTSDQATAGGRSPFLDTYRADNSATFDDAPKGTFTLRSPRS